MAPQKLRSPKAANIHRPRLGFLLRGAYRLHAGVLQERMKAREISHSEFLHLYLLRRWGRLSPGEITSRLEVTKAAATAVLKSLRDKHLIVSAANAEDSRKLDIDLSARGVRLIETLLDRADEATDVALAGFSAAERAALFAQLSRIIDNLRAGSAARASPERAAE